MSYVDLEVGQAIHNDNVITVKRDAVVTLLTASNEIITLTRGQYGAYLFQQAF